jgi:hypothetical protein
LQKKTIGRRKLCLKFPIKLCQNFINIHFFRHMWVLRTSLQKNVSFLSPELICTVLGRVARWFVFKPKIQIWVNFGGSCDGRWWYILWTLGPFYGLLLYFMDLWYSLW